MGVTFIAPQGTYTAPAKLVTKEITENGTYDATDDSANGYSSVTVNVEGGGGSSDFSTAEVTIVNSSKLPTTLYFPYINPEFNDIEVFKVGSMGTLTYTVPLYMNGATMSFDEMPAGINITGDAEIDENLVVITGDCTITIS